VKGMPTATLTTKGQITIPKPVRDALGIRTGDRVHFQIEGEGRVILKAATLDVSKLEGILHRRGMKAITVEEMNQSIRKRFRKAL